MVSEYQRQYCTFLPGEKAAPKRTTFAASEHLLHQRRVQVDEEEEEPEEIKEEEQPADIPGRVSTPRQQQAKAAQSKFRQQLGEGKYRS